MNNQKYSVIVFDLGNVLIPFDYNIFIKKLDDVEAGLGKRFYDLYQTNYNVHRDFERWSLTTEDFLKTMSEWTEGKVDDENFCEYYSEVFTVNENVAALLPGLKKRYKLVLLSNTNYIHQKYGWEKYDFLKHFDKLILSHEVGAIKPEPEIYNAVMAFTNKPPEEHIFIDDIADYVEGAKKMGWGGIQFKNYDQLVKDLKAREIL